MNKKVLAALGVLLMLSGCSNNAVKCEGFKEEFRHDEVLFSTGKADLTPEGKKVLDKQIAWLKKNPQKKIIIQGYTDPRGTEAYNMKLGEKRAEAVKKYITNAGINPDRVSVVSLGETELATTQNTPKGWAEDRRTVTVIVTD
ncbi:MAG: OmpA family protein [Alphaproteobacteria bacterium]|nr:OmpA family protein [Alphaproteobacteria bacterium]